MLSCRFSNVSQICTPVKVPAGSLLALFCSFFIHLFSSLLNFNLKHFLSVIREEHLRDIQITNHSSLCLSASLIYQFVSSGRH